MKRLNVEIIKPSINNSYADFRAIDGKIYYGLGAIKNVGFEAISNIIKERENNGNFSSLNNFINRIKSKDINKLQLEGLTKAGVFDEFDTDRGKIFTSIPNIIQQIKILMMIKIIINQVFLKIKLMILLNLDFYRQNHGNKKIYYLKNLNLWDFIFLIIH